MPFATHFVGRTSELSLLDDTLDALDRGEASALEIVGAAGIGKTRLLTELARCADERGHIVLRGAGDELEQDLPFWVFVDALDEYVEGIEPRRLERLDPLVRADLGNVLPSLAVAGEGGPAAVHERYRTHRAMRALLEQLAATKPLVLILDDFHWADAASVDLFVALLHRLPDARVLLVIASRPRQLPARLASALDRAHRDRKLARLELQELTQEEAEVLVGPGAAAIYADSGGNPFFLEQLARLPGVSSAAAAGVDVAGVTVPPLVVATLNEELARLSGQARRVLDAASVAGDPFEVEIAAAAADLAEPAVLDAIDELVRVELLRLTDMPRRFGFRHPIVRRAVYEATPGGWRIGAHERIAGLLAARGANASTVAQHVERSARHGDAAAIATLRAAGDETASRAPETAARWFAAALRLLPDAAAAAERVELLLARAQALIASGGFRDGHAALLESLELIGEGPSPLRTKVAAMCARVEHLLGSHETAHGRLLQALDELPDERSPEGVALMIELTMDGMHRLNYLAMQEWGDRAAAAAEGLDDDALRAAALAAASRGAAFNGETPTAARRYDEAAALIDRLPDRVLARRLDALGSLAGTELYLHRFADGHAHAARALDIGRATGQGQQFPLLYAILGQTAYFFGRSAEMTDVLDAGVEAARLTGNAQTLAWSLYPRSMAAFLLGDLATALATAQEAVDAVDDGKPSHHFSHCAFALAEATLELGRADEAVALLRRSGAGEAMPLAAPSFRSLFLEAMVRAHLAAGDAEAAGRAAELSSQAADAVALELPRAWADRAAAAVALAAGDARQAAGLASASASTLEASGVVVEAGRSLALAGRGLAAAGERAAARESLERAAHIFGSHGAERFRQAAERELRQLGHRIHAHQRSAPAGGQGGVESLTKRECEIARHIVDRKTNREIAEALFLSTKTVETHIRNIFAKLGADSRVDVARIMERADRLAGSPS